MARPWRFNTSTRTSAADIFTKALPPEKWFKALCLLGIRTGLKEWIPSKKDRASCDPFVGSQARSSKPGEVVRACTKRCCPKSGRGESRFKGPLYKAASPYMYSCHSIRFARAFNMFVPTGALWLKKTVRQRCFHRAPHCTSCGGRAFVAFASAPSLSRAFRSLDRRRAFVRLWLLFVEPLDHWPTSFTPFPLTELV